MDSGQHKGVTGGGWEMGVKGENFFWPLAWGSREHGAEVPSKNEDARHGQHNEIGEQALPCTVCPPPLMRC